MCVRRSAANLRRRPRLGPSGTAALDPTRGADASRLRRAARLILRAEDELLIDCEEDRTFRAVLVGMLREADRSS